MIDKVSKLAERVATGVSRRQFCSWVGQRALSLAAVLGGVGVAHGLAPGIVSCVLNGGCCTGVTPYLGTESNGRMMCYKSANCSTAIGQRGLCCASTCCNGSGVCVAGWITSGGVHCYSGHGCGDALC